MNHLNCLLNQLWEPFLGVQISVGQIVADIPQSLERQFSFRVLVVVIFHRQLNSPHPDSCQKITFHVYHCRKQWLAWIVNKIWHCSKNLSLSYFTPSLILLYSLLGDLCALPAPRNLAHTISSLWTAPSLSSATIKTVFRKEYTKSKVNSPFFICMKQYS